VTRERRSLLIQRRKAAGLSQEALAELLGVDRSTVLRWESGSTGPQPWVRPQLAEALQITVDQLDDLLRGDVESDPATVDRRAFAGLATGLALAPLTRPRTGSLLGAGEVRQLQARTARIRRLDDHLGGMDTYRVYTAEMAATTKLIKQASYTQATAKALTGVLAEQAQMAGWAAYDAGRYSDSRRHYKAALGAARESGDTSLISNSMAFIAYEKADIQTATESTKVAGTTATPVVRALLHERLAWTHAVAGDADQAARALDLAQAAITTPGTGPEPDFVWWVDQLEIEIMAGRCWTELHRPERAVPILERGLAAYDDTHSRDKALYLTWLAHAYLDDKQPEQAAVVVDRAFDLSAGIGSVRPGARIQAVLRRLSRYRDLPAAAAVLERARG
jgi:transcriptional regulator with XRE-family HTH domain/tetratricopeptide (TPR) repeat protein